MANEVKVDTDIPQTVNYQTCTVQAGTTTTLASNQNATVTNSGTQYNAIFNFGIPRGKSAYEQAVAGGYTGTEAEFNAALASDITTVATNISDINTVGADIANVNTVAGNTTNIDTVAGISSDVTTVAGISSDVTNVSGISNAIVAVDNNESAIQNVSDNLANVNSVASNMNSVLATAADITNINTVANNTTNIDTVAGISTNVTTVAGIAADVTAVKNNATDISTVATNITDVGTVAADTTAISAVAADLTNIDAVNANKTNIDAVAGNNTNITAVAGNATNINAVNANKSNIDAVAGNSSNINSVAGNATNINTVATNISDIGTVAGISTDVSAVAGVAADVSAVAADLENIDTAVENLSDLQDKQNKVLTTPVTIDGNEKTTVESALGALSDEWVKPSDWVDIRSGAIPNSIYALVGHSADYATCDNCGFKVTLTNAAHSFNVYIDNNLYGTYTSGTSVTWSWSTLALTSGSTTTTPAAFNTHIIRITPTTSEGVFKRFEVMKKSSNREVQGWLWVHFAIESIESVALQNYPNIKPTYLTAVTALGDNLHMTANTAQAFLGGTYDLWNDISQNLAYLPTIEVENLVTAAGMFNFSGPLKKAKLVVNGTLNSGTSGQYPHFCIHGLEEIDINKPIIIKASAHSIFRESCLKRLPAIDVSATTDLDNFLTLDTKLEPTVLDFSTAKLVKKVGCYGSSTKQMTGLKGLLVSNEAPFDNTNSPQINVSYTGLDRAALVNLFKSMPYNVGYTVVGSPTITDGVASGFSKTSLLQTSSTIKPEYITERVVKVKFNSSAIGSGYNNALFGPNSMSISFYSGSSDTTVSAVTCYLPGDGKSLYKGSLGLVVDTWYWFKYTYDGTTASIYSSDDGATYTLLDSRTATISGNGSNVSIGGRWNGSDLYFNGSIDLNHTYININGVPWFRGTAAMTKTCSIVGCTGTANLTAEDKAIATNKGWSLTLS